MRLILRTLSGTLEYPYTYIQDWFITRCLNFKSSNRQTNNANIKLLYTLYIYTVYHCTLNNCEYFVPLYHIISYFVRAFLTGPFWQGIQDEKRQARLVSDTSLCVLFIVKRRNMMNLSYAPPKYRLLEKCHLKTYFNVYFYILYGAITSCCKKFVSRIRRRYSGVWSNIQVAIMRQVVMKIPVGLNIRVEFLFETHT